MHSQTSEAQPFWFPGGTPSDLGFTAQKFLLYLPDLLSLDLMVVWYINVHSFKWALTLASRERLWLLEATEDVNREIYTPYGLRIMDLNYRRMVSDRMLNEASIQ